MFVLRRAALRACTRATAPSVFVAKPKTFITLAQFRAQPAHRCSVSRTIQRFASGEAEEKTPSGEAEEKTPSAEEADSASSASSESLTDSFDHAPESAGSEDAAGSQPPGSERVHYSSGMESKATLYVGNLLFEVTEMDLKEHFSQFGTLKSARLVLDPSGRSKGFGYVEYESTDDAARALEAANMQTYQGRRLTVQYHRPRTPLRHRSVPNPPSKTLFIGNMSFEMSDKDLSDLFREVRNVIDVRIAIDRRTGQPRGFAHADFIDVDSAVKALEYLNGKEMYGRVLRVDYSSSSRVGSAEVGNRFGGGYAN